MKGVEDVDWGEPTDFATHAVSHRRYTTPASPLIALPEVEGPYRAVFWAKIGPGGFIMPHIDAGPFYERWHIPVQPAGMFWEDGRYMNPISPFIVHHWLPHAVWNPTSVARVHLIVDRDIIPPDAPTQSKLILL
jgi:hypothetical protein